MGFSQPKIQELFNHAIKLLSRKAFVNQLGYIKQASVLKIISYDPRHSHLSDRIVLTCFNEMATLHSAYETESSPTEAPQHASVYIICKKVIINATTNVHFHRKFNIFSDGQQMLRVHAYMQITNSVQQINCTTIASTLPFGCNTTKYIHSKF